MYMSLKSRASALDLPHIAESMSALCLDSGYPFRVLHGVDHIEKTAPLGALADFPPIEASGR